MFYNYPKKRCHWCNRRLMGKKERFCSDRCKAAHRRARKRYVTEVARQGKSGLVNGYARGKVKKKKKLTKP